jgi:hypothetical protein
MCSPDVQPNAVACGCICPYISYIHLQLHPPVSGFPSGGHPVGCAGRGKAQTSTDEHRQASQTLAWHRLSTVPASSLLRCVILTTTGPTLTFTKPNTHQHSRATTPRWILVLPRTCSVPAKHARAEAQTAMVSSKGHQDPNRMTNLLPTSFLVRKWTGHPFLQCGRTCSVQIHRAARTNHPVPNPQTYLCTLMYLSMGESSGEWWGSGELR